MSKPVKEAPHAKAAHRVTTPRTDASRSSRESLGNQHLLSILRTQPAETSAEASAERRAAGISSPDRNQQPITLPVLPSLESRVTPPRAGWSVPASSAGSPLGRLPDSSLTQQFDLSQVRIHRGTDAARFAQAFQARAFTVGRDIFFGAGQYNPENRAGHALLEHELRHVAQQASGEVAPGTLQRDEAAPAILLEVPEAAPFAHYERLRQSVSAEEWNGLNRGARARWVAQAINSGKGGDPKRLKELTRGASMEVQVALGRLIEPTPQYGMVMLPSRYRELVFAQFLSGAPDGRAIGEVLRTELARRWAEADESAMIARVRVAIVDPNGQSQSEPELLFLLNDHPLPTKDGTLYLAAADAALYQILPTITAGVEAELTQVQEAAQLYLKADAALQQSRSLLDKGHFPYSQDFVNSLVSELGSLQASMASYAGQEAPLLATKRQELDSYVESEVKPFAAAHPAYLLAHAPMKTNYEVHQEMSEWAFEQMKHGSTMDKVAAAFAMMPEGNTPEETIAMMPRYDAQTALNQAYRAGHISPKALEEGTEEIRNRELIAAAITVGLTIATIGLAGPILGEAASVGATVLYGGLSSAITTTTPMIFQSLYTSSHPLSDPYAQAIWSSTAPTPGQIALAGTVSFALGAALPATGWLGRGDNAVAARALALASAEGRPLGTLPSGVTARVIAAGELELSIAGEQSVIRVTPTGFRVMTPAGKSGQLATVFERAWGEAPIEVSAAALEKAPWLAGVQDVAMMGAAGQPLAFGVTEGGWFVYQPTTRAPFSMGPWGPGGVGAGESLIPAAGGSLVPPGFGAAQGPVTWLGPAPGTAMVVSEGAPGLLASARPAFPMIPPGSIPELPSGAVRLPGFMPPQMPFGRLPLQLAPGFIPQQLASGPIPLQLPAPSDFLLGPEEWNAPTTFHTLPKDRLPDLPKGYQWQRQGGQWVPTRPASSGARPLRVHFFGPDAEGRFNVNIVASDGRFVSTSSMTLPKGQGSLPRYYPIETDDFIDAKSGLPWDRGHVVEHYDTLRGPGISVSTYEAGNYVPEPKWWNRWIRNPLVGKIRERGNGYRAIYEYGPSPRMTKNGTPIPDRLYFLETDPKGRVIDGWNIPFDNPVVGPTGLDALGQFKLPDVSHAPITRIPR